MIEGDSQVFISSHTSGNIQGSPGALRGHWWVPDVAVARQQSVVMAVMMRSLGKDWTTLMR